MVREARCARGEAVEMRRCELGAAIGAQHVAVEAVEQNDDGKLCVDRDRLLSRAGAKCRISNLNRLVAVTDDR